MILHHCYIKTGVADFDGIHVVCNNLIELGDENWSNLIEFGNENPHFNNSICMFWVFFPHFNNSILSSKLVLVLNLIVFHVTKFECFDRPGITNLNLYKLHIYFGENAFRALTCVVHIGMPNREREDARASSKYFETVLKNHSSNAMNEEGNNFEIENLNADVSTFWRRASMKEDTLVWNIGISNMEKRTWMFLFLRFKVVEPFQ